MYENFLPSKEDFLDRNFLAVLPKLNAHGRPVILIKAGAWEPRDTPQELFQRGIIMCLEYMALDPVSQTAGVASIADFSGYSFYKALACNWRLVRQIVNITQEGLPLRLKEVHIVRQPLTFSLLHALMRPFLKKKIADRFHVHGTNFKALHEHIPPDMLPEEYGGLGPPVDYAASTDRIRKQEEAFLENERYGYK